MGNRQQRFPHFAPAKEDILGPDYYAHTLDSQADQVCTLVEYRPEHTHEGQEKLALLYVHGYTDYFFQTHQAEYFDQLGLRFFAVDLHGYGRAIRPTQNDHNNNRFENYFADLQACLAHLSQQGFKRYILLGHSTGGLICTRFLQEMQQGRWPEANKQPELAGLILNSPFFSLPMPLKDETWRLPLYRWISRLLSGLSLANHKATIYAQSIHASLEGEWHYRLDWKPSQGSPLSFYWLKQIIAEQAACLNTNLGIPTLLCRSNKSTYHAKTLHDLIQGDGVLDVENMQAKTEQIFSQLDTAIISGGFHDLLLSPTKVRQAYLDATAHWLSQQSLINISPAPSNQHE